MDIKQLQKRIEDLEAKINQSSNEMAQLEGRISAVKEQLKKEFGCDTPEGVEQKIAVIRKEIEDLTDEKIEVHKELDTLLEGK